MDIATKVINETHDSPAGAPPVRVGIVGLGRTVFDDHLPAFRALGGQFEVVAACDLLKLRRSQAEEFYPSLRHYRRIDDMLDDPELEVVLFATPSPDHQKQALLSLRRKIWTVVETPPAMTLEGAQVLMKANERSGNRLIVSTPFLFSPAFELAKKARGWKALGEVFDVRVAREDFLRRDDWQAIDRCGGGIARFAALEPLMAAKTLLGAPPRQLWSELKRVAGVGDAEDYAHIILKTNTPVTADITVSSAIFDARDAEYELRGSRGVFRVMPGAAEGELRAIDPSYKMPRRRSGVAVPDLSAPRETFPVVCEKTAASDALSGHARMWRAIHACVRDGASWPIAFEDVAESLRLLDVVRQSAKVALPKGRG